LVVSLDMETHDRSVIHAVSGIEVQAGGRTEVVVVV